MRTLTHRTRILSKQLCNKKYKYIKRDRFYSRCFFECELKWENLPVLCSLTLYLILYSFEENKTVYIMYIKHFKMSNTTEKLITWQQGQVYSSIVQVLFITSIVAIFLDVIHTVAAVLFFSPVGMNWFVFFHSQKFIQPKLIHTDSEKLYVWYDVTNNTKWISDSLIYRENKEKFRFEL